MTVSETLTMEEKKVVFYLVEDCDNALVLVNMRMQLVCGSEADGISESLWVLTMQLHRAQ